MPSYLSILRSISIYSIFALFIIVAYLLLVKGKIREFEFALIYYVWLPIAVLTQFLMTYFRVEHFGSNLPVMNIYLMIEFTIFVYVLLQIRSKTKGIKNNNILWIVIVLVSYITHLFDDFNSIHNAAMLYMSIIYFQITVNNIDLNEIEKIYNDPFTLFNIAVFIKAFGYSYFLIYRLDYKFPLSIYSIVNLMVQVILVITILFYYKKEKTTTN